MTILRDAPEMRSPAGITEEADWETLLDYTGEITEEVVRSWWADVPVGAWPEVSKQLSVLDAEDPKLAQLIRRVTGL
jgi:hypothetical protein